MKDVALFIVVLVVLLAMPAAMIWSVVDHVKNGHKRARRESGGTAVGSALQELDRLVARPAVEHTIEAERPVMRREDDQGGE